MTASPTTTATTDDSNAPTSRRSSRWLLILAAALCYALAWWLAGMVGISRARGFDGSLLLSGGAFTKLVMAAALVLVGVNVGTLVAGRVRPDAGLFAAAFGLMALSNRGKPIYSVLHDAGGSRSAFLLMALELVLLYAMLGFAWLMLQRLQRRGRLQSDAARDGLADLKQEPAAGWTALLTHVAIMAGVMLILVQSEDKKQVMAAVAIASFCGAFFPYTKRGAYPSVWYWAGPLVLGLVGYLLNFLFPSQDLAVGRPRGAGAIHGAWACPLPLDYASLGTAAAILSYWMRRKGIRDREQESAGKSRIVVKT